MSKLAQLKKDTVLYGISTVVGRFINFILVPFYTNLFIPSDYGIITNIYAAIAVFAIVLLFGMDTAYLKYAGMAEPEERPGLFVQAFYPVLTADIIISLFVVLFARQIANLLGIPAEYTYLIYYMCAILSLDALTSLPFITLRLGKKALRFSMIKLTNIILTIILNIVLIVFLRWGIKAVLISNLIASAVTLLILVPVFKDNLSSAFEFRVFRKLLKFGLPYLPAGIASMFLQVIDRPIVEKMAGMKMLGIYQANYRLGIFMMLFVSMFQYAWQPFFLENAKDPGAKNTFAKVFTYFTAAGAVILVVLSLFIDDAAKMHIGGVSLIGKAYWEGLNIVPIVLLAYLFNGFYVNFAAGLFITEKSMAFPVILGIGAVSNVAANILLIPFFSITGAAFATLISYALMAVLFYAVSNKHYPMCYEKGKLLIILVLTTITGTAYYYLQGIGALNLTSKSLLLIFFLTGMYISGILRTSLFFSFRRKK